MKEFVRNTKNLKVLTPDGWKSFAGVAFMGKKQIYVIKFGDGSLLECSENHRLFGENDVEYMVSTMDVGTNIIGIDGKLLIVEAITKTDRIEDVYDLVDVDGGYKYFTNNVLSHNCQFIQESETLINEMLLARMQGVDPKFITGQIRWYNIPEPNKTFVVALDPSMGTGGDYAAIEVFQLPEMKQIAEWKDNKTDIRGQISCLMQVLLYINTHLRSHPDQGGNPEIYWTVENNSIGEAALIVIEETGEENFPGEMVSELRRSGNVRRFRKGLNTTNKTKIEACSRLKSLVDTERLIPLSKNLVSELKNFVPRGGSYSAKLGMTDDLVSATLLCVRMLQILRSWGVDEMENLKDVIPLGEHDIEPMPMVIF